MACVLVLACAGVAEAHAQLVSSNPRNGAVLAVPPSTIRLTFDETVTRMNLVVFAPDGSRVRISQQRSVNATTTAHIAAPRQQGRWTVGYRVVSADGHPVAGTVGFTTASGAKVKQVNPLTVQPSFVHRHRDHLLWSALAVIVGAVLIFSPSMRRKR